MKNFSGKRYFRWLGFQNGTRKLFRKPNKALPMWAQDAYGGGWINGFHSVSSSDDK